MLSDIILVRIYLFLKIYATSEGAASHNVLYYQQLSNARYQVSFYVMFWVITKRVPSLQEGSYAPKFELRMLYS